MSTPTFEGHGSDDPSARQRTRRWPWSVGATIILLAGVAATLRLVWLPQHRPALGAGERYGIDVSHHQGEIDWPRVAGDNITFAYIKATEGGDFLDERFTHNWDAAGRAGIERGAYHFFTLCTPGDLQARHFLDVVPAGQNALPPAVDLELAGNCAARPDDADVRSELRAFVELIEADTDQEIVLYVGDDFERRYPVRESLDRPLWQRRFLLRPDVDGWWIWQVTGFAHIDGISGDVDLNVMRR